MAGIAHMHNRTFSAMGQLSHSHDQAKSMALLNLYVVEGRGRGNETVKCEAKEHQWIPTTAEEQSIMYVEVHTEGEMF